MTAPSPSTATLTSATAQSISPRPVPRWALWTGALSLAALATVWLWDASPGLNFPILALPICAGLLACWRSNQNGWHPNFVVPLVLTVFVTTAAAITADGPNEIFIALIALLGLASAVAAAFRRSGTHDPKLSWLIVTPLGFFFLLYESFLQATSTYEALCETRSRAALRGVALAVPTTLVLALLLSNADPTFASVRDVISKAILDIKLLPQAIFFGLVAVCLLGSAGLVLKATQPEYPDDSEATLLLDRPLGDTEPLIVLGAVATLFALFLVLQIAYLFGNPGGQAGSGMSYADAVHRGFVELNIVSTVCGALLLALRRCAQPGPRRPWVRILEGVVIAETMLLLISAFHRVNVYESAYGFTTQRLYVQAYAVIGMILLGVLFRELRGQPSFARLVRTGVTLGVLAFGGLIYVNADAWIARANLARYAETQRIDTGYLLNDLGSDAVPTLIGALSTLPPSLAAAIKSSLQKRYARDAQEPAPRWYEWSWRRQALRTAMTRLDDPTP